MENTIFIENFNELLSEKGLNRKTFAKQSGIPYTTVIGWTKLMRLPDYAALIKIADFFGCSIDYLVGRQDDFGNTLYGTEIRNGELQFLKYFRKLDAENKELVLKLIINLSKTK